MAGTPPQTQVHQGSGGGTGASPGFDWAKGFFNSLPGVFNQQYPSQYPGQLDPGLSPTMQQVLRQAQGYSSQGPSSNLQGIQGTLGSFMSPNFINPQLRAGQGYPDYYHTDPNAPTYGGGTVGQLPGFNPMNGQGGMNGPQAGLQASLAGSPGNGMAGAFGAPGAWGQPGSGAGVDPGSGWGGGGGGGAWGQPGSGTGVEPPSQGPTRMPASGALQELLARIRMGGGGGSPDGRTMPIQPGGGGALGAYPAPSPMPGMTNMYRPSSWAPNGTPAGGGDTRMPQMPGGGGAPPPMKMPLQRPPWTQQGPTNW